MALVPSTLEGANITQDTARLAFLPEIYPPFAFYYLQSPSVQRFLGKIARGVAVKGVNIGDLRGLPFPVASEREQRRVVDILEDQLSRLDAATENVRSAEARLKTLEAALITTDAEIRSSPVVSLSDLLSEPLANGRSVPTGEVGFPILRLTSLKDRGIDLSERKIGDWTPMEAMPFLVERGDFLVSRGNGSLKLVGAGGLVRSVPDGIAYPDTIIRVRLNREIVDPEYLSLIWASRIVRRQVESMARTTAGIYKVNQKQLSGIQLPVPGLEVQREVTQRIASQLPVLTRARHAIEINSQRGVLLRQSLLAAAFLGQLTGRDSDIDRVREEVNA